MPFHAVASGGSSDHNSTAPMKLQTIFRSGLVSQSAPSAQSAPCRSVKQPAQKAAPTAPLSPGQTGTDSDFDAQARKLVSHMTLDEKLDQIHGTSNKHVNRIVLGLDRLHIPALTITNGPAGAGPAGPGHEGAATAFPAPISLAATWDLNAAAIQGKVSAIQARQLGNLAARVTRHQHGKDPAEWTYLRKFW